MPPVEAVGEPILPGNCQDQNHKRKLVSLNDSDAQTASNFPFRWWGAHVTLLSRDGSMSLHRRDESHTPTREELTMKMQIGTWTLVIVAITLLTGVAYGGTPTSPATVAQVDVQHGWLCVGPMGSFRESFDVPGSSLALTTEGKPLVALLTVDMQQQPDFQMSGRDFRRCW
jgi:hypothetical protein